MADKFKLSRKAKKIILGACIGGVVVLTAGLFTYIHIADTNTLGRKISIYGMDVSTLTADKAEQKLLDAFRSRKVQFKEGGSDVYQTTVSELGYDLDESALKSELTELQTTREANRKIFATQEDYKIAYQIQKDEEQEKKALASSNFGDKERTASVDAAVQYDEQQKQFVLVNDVQGNEIDETRLQSYVDQMLDDNFRLKLLGGDIQITLDTNVYQQPSVTASDEMQNKVTGLNDQLNKYRSTTVTYTLGSTTEVIDAGTIEYLSAVYNWMIRQISGWIMKNFARSLKKEWNPADISSQGEYDAYPLKIATNGRPEENTQKPEVNYSVFR